MQQDIACLLLSFTVFGSETASGQLQRTRQRHQKHYDDLIAPVNGILKI